MSYRAVYFFISQANPACLPRAVSTRKGWFLRPTDFPIAVLWRVNTLLPDGRYVDAALNKKGLKKEGRNAEHANLPLNRKDQEQAARIARPNEPAIKKYSATRVRHAFATVTLVSMRLIVPTYHGTAFIRQDFRGAGLRRLSRPRDLLIIDRTRLTGGGETSWTRTRRGSFCLHELFRQIIFIHTISGLFNVDWIIFIL